MGMALPLPAVLMIAVGIYVFVLAMALWFRHCLKDRCTGMWKGLLSGPLPLNVECANWDCTCTCQPPECESCNCLCFEIKLR
ncbi:uncharacterized protein si:ch211-198p11.6 [Gadus macrocephalus]|uniref:uncharacterized protein si:ch211-198p11.6 n=1 Tax=Gadus macrocephalus TaxID=80720 RepID=UPI0028CBBC58|nr:uncharacterized protein si:ch211-198p11.6 [Gadus macrocephalus]